MADMSDELYIYPWNKARSQVWTYFGFKKINVRPPIKENLLNTTFLWQEILSKLKYRRPSDHSVNCILFIYINLALNYQI